MSSKIAQLWVLTRGQRHRYLIGIAAMATSIVLVYLAPIITRGAIDGILDPAKASTGSQRVVQLIGTLAGPKATVGTKLAMAGLMILALTLVSGLFNYIRARCSATAAEQIARDLRGRLYSHLQHLPCTYYDKAQTGDLVQRCTSDVDTVRQFFGTQIIEVLRAVTLILTVVPLLLYMDWRQGLISLAVVPLMVGFAVVFFARMRSSFKAMDEAEGAMTTVLQENLTGIRVVRAFARHDFEKEKFETRNTRHRQLNYRMIRLMAFYWAMADLLVFLQMSLVLLTCAWRAAHHQITIGDMVAFGTYVGMYVWPLRQMGRVVAELGKATVSIGRIQEILNQPAESAPTPAPAPGLAPEELPARVSGRIDLENVTFRHGDKLVLQNVSLAIRPGETIAIMGPSGSGKSTLLHLLLRLYDHAEGSIRLDGRDLKELDRKYVRAQFGVVMQEPFLYSKTLGENIRLGRHTASNEEVVASAQAADVHGAIDGFDKKYDTLVGERGVTLSGGQRQRVAIARALLIEAPILVLDDALSAVDMRTETHILSALRQRKGKHTTLLVAHRLSTLMQADRIVVLENGRLTQCGSHDQLVAQEGLYRRLWQIQGELEDDLRSEFGPTNPNPDAEPDDLIAGARSE
jgi:ATP-binding cassette, subfamily B, bacterial